MVTSGANCRWLKNAIGGPVTRNGIYATERAGIVTALLEKGIIISPLSPIKTFLPLISTADPEKGSDVCYQSVLRIVA